MASVANLATGAFFVSQLLPWELRDGVAKVCARRVHVALRGEELGVPGQLANCFEVGAASGLHANIVPVALLASASRNQRRRCAGERNPEQFRRRRAGCWSGQILEPDSILEGTSATRCRR